MKDDESIKEKVIRENIKLFDELVDVYDAEHGYLRGNYFDKITDKDIELILSLVSGKDVLDVGGGTGFPSFKFLEKGYNVDVIDISKPMLDKFQQKLKPGMRANLICGNAEDELRKLSDKQYDVVMCSSFLHHIYNHEEVLSQMIPLVKKEGVFYVSNEPFKALNLFHYLDAFINKIMHNRAGFALAIKRIVFSHSTSFADYHILHKKGLPLDGILSQLRNNGFKIVDSEKYSLSHYKIFYLINKYFFHFFNGWFKIIARKV